MNKIIIRGDDTRRTGKPFIPELEGTTVVIVPSLSTVVALEQLGKDYGLDADQIISITKLQLPGTRNTEKFIKEIKEKDNIIFWEPGVYLATRSNRSRVIREIMCRRRFDNVIAVFGLSPLGSGIETLYNTFHNMFPRILTREFKKKLGVTYITNWGSPTRDKMAIVANSLANYKKIVDKVQSCSS